MRENPRIVCRFPYLSGEGPAWERLLDRPIPLNHSDFSCLKPSGWVYRDFFRAVSGVLARDDFSLLKGALRLKGPAEEPFRLKTVILTAEKHGNWYHPVKIEVVTPRGRFFFSCNVALHERGIALLQKEAQILTALGNRYPYPWLPKVYDYGLVPSASPALIRGMKPWGYLLADWFQGFHEFHLTSTPNEQNPRLLLWDGNPKPTILSPEQTRGIYRQVAFILTSYYDPVTYEQIAPWHHGSGDFVARIQDPEVGVRLTTVRGYWGLMDSKTPPEEALLFFFLNFTLRMRLDRLDGVGELTFAGGDCLVPTWEGFQQGLAFQKREGRIPLPLFQSFHRLITALSLSDLTERFSALCESYHPEAQDLPVIKGNLVSHLMAVYQLIKDQKFKKPKIRESPEP